VIEIIPNWHPIFVHFTVALFTISVGFYGLAYIGSFLKKAPGTFTHEFEIVARWCLWVGALVTIITVFAGLYAFNTVQHDEISHAAMLEHRNWAFPTATAILIIACWSFLQHIRKKTVTLTFLIVLLMIEGALMSTAWHGSELVYRYGLGVMSSPKAGEVGHFHHHHTNE